MEGRRRFLETCGNTLVGITILGATPLMQGCEISKILNPPHPQQNREIDVSGLTADGESMVTTETGSDGMRMLIVRVSESEYLVMSMECTHSFCEVRPPNSEGALICPCHGSEFDLTGAVVQGPAPRPLKRYGTTFDPSSQRLTIIFS